MVQRKEAIYSFLCRYTLYRPLGIFFSFIGMNDETKNPDLQFLAGTDIEYQYSKEPESGSLCITDLFQNKSVAYF